MTPLEEIIREVVKLRSLVVREAPKVRDATFVLDDPSAVNTMQYLLGFVRGCLHEMTVSVEDQLVHIGAHHANCVEQAQEAGDASPDLGSRIAIPTQPGNESVEANDSTDEVEDEDETETAGDHEDGNPPRRH